MERERIYEVCHSAWNYVLDLDSNKDKECNFYYCWLSLHTLYSEGWNVWWSTHCHAVPQAICASVHSCAAARKQFTRLRQGETLAAAPSHWKVKRASVDQIHSLVWSRHMQKWGWWGENPVVAEISRIQGIIWLPCPHTWIIALLVPLCSLIPGQSISTCLGGG